jgi:hypothetical protein
VSKRTFGTGAQRNHAAGKGRYDLLPHEGIAAVARVAEDGAREHGERNWERGIPLSSFLDSGIRHAFQVLAGATDEDHAARAAWNLLAFLSTRARIQAGTLPAELDDLPR